MMLCLSYFHIGHTQILPDSENMGGGDSFTKVTTELTQNTDVGHIRTIACGGSFTRYNICLKWISLKQEKSSLCFRVNQGALNSSFLSPDKTRKMAWAKAPMPNPDFLISNESQEIGYLFYADEQPKDWEGQAGFQTGFSQAQNAKSHYEGKWRRSALTLSMTCPDENQPTKYVGDSLNYLGDFKPLSIEKGIEDCLLAERKIGTDGTTYAYDRSRFICVPAETKADAEKQRVEYANALIRFDGFDHLKKQIQKNSKNLFIVLAKDKIPYSDICQTQVRVQTISAKDIDNFYADIDYEREFANKKAALLFVFREVDCAP